MNYESIPETLHAEVKKIYRLSTAGDTFHNKTRRKGLFKLVTEFSAIYKLADEDRFTLECAALIYGTGYLNGSADPAAISLSNADHLLAGSDLTPVLIIEIKRVIKAAMSAAMPDTQTAQIFCDCVFSFYGEDGFKYHVKLLFKEAKRRDPAASKTEFYKTLLKQMDEFQYATPIAQERFNASKLHNRLALIKEIPNVHLTPIKEHHKEITEHVEAKASESKANKQ
jgi:hypothetical protein